MVDVDMSCQENHEGNDFTVVDLKVLRSLFSKAQHSARSNLTIEFSKWEKEYGLTVKLVLECSTRIFKVLFFAKGDWWC